MNSKLLKYVKTKFVRIADDLMENPQGLKFKLDKASEKLTKTAVIESLGVYASDLKTLIRMARLWATRKYTNVGKQTILYTIVAVIYFVTPTDFVPDFLLGLGFIDDMTVISWVLVQIKDDLKLFRDWDTDQEKLKKGKKK